MRTTRATWIGAFALALAGAAFAQSMLAAGSHQPAPSRGADQVRLAAQPLPAFHSCAQLRRWYVREALPYVGPWGFGGPVRFRPLAAANASSQGVAGDMRTPIGAVGSSASGTNVQEQGVDEPDLAKTDGHLVVHTNRHHLVVTDVSGHDPRVLSRLRLPGELYAPQLLLSGPTVLVLGWEPGSFHRGPLWAGPAVGGQLMRYPPVGMGGRTALVSVDISRPSAPVVDSVQRIGAALESARLYPDGTVRVVVSSGFPALHFVHPTRQRTARQATQENKRILRHAPIDRWLPQVSTGGAKWQRLVSCSEVRHPKVRSGFGTLTVLTFPVQGPETYQSTAVTAAGDLVYSSLDRLYVATTSEPAVMPMPVGPRPPTWRPHTTIDAFALTPASTRFVASGTVPGLLRDRWSMSEYDGHLRVVTGLADERGPADNALFVLDEHGSSLDVVGKLTGLGLRQQVQSVRWLGDLAVVTTFRAVDPLYTIDLSDPTKPRVLGALHIGGYSGYLHPVGDDFLLGLGAAVSHRRTVGAQAATFDLSDLTKVRRSGRVAFGQDTAFDAIWDQHAFTYLPALHRAITVLEDERIGPTKVVTLRLGRQGGLSAGRSWTLPGWPGDSVRTLPLGGHRVALVEPLARQPVRLINLG